MLAPADDEELAATRTASTKRRRERAVPMATMVRSDIPGLELCRPPLRCHLRDGQSERLCRCRALRERTERERHRDGRPRPHGADAGRCLRPAPSSLRAVGRAVAAQPFLLSLDIPHIPPFRVAQTWHVRHDAACGINGCDEGSVSSVNGSRAKAPIPAAPCPADRDRALLRLSQSIRGCPTWPGSHPSRCCRPT